MWSSAVAVGVVVPRAPGLIWVHGLLAGDVMVDRSIRGSIRGDRLRPLGLFGTAAGERESQHLRELAGSLSVIWDWWAWRKRSLGARPKWFR